jgi:hypothetical protein
MIINIIQQWLMPQYTDNQIIDNIVEIRKILGELDEQGRPVQIPYQQAQPASAAAQIHPAQQAAAAIQEEEISPSEIERIIKSSESGCVIC